MPQTLLVLTKIRNLELAHPSSPGRPSHLSAASGLVRCGSELYVIADDEHHLGVFPARGSGAGRLLRLLDGALPDGAAERKARKPDFEALALLPAFAGCPHGALLALGSGSKRERRRAVLLPLDRDGAIGAGRVLDLSRLFAALDQRLGEANIEGAVVQGDRLCLLQRGGRDRANALVRLPLRDALGDAPIRALDIRECELGSVDGVALGFTDGAALPDGSIVFSAVAEDTPDSYRDGPCGAAAIGIADRDGSVRVLRRIEPAHKIEGIDAQADGAIVRLLLVSDADDPLVPAGLFSASL